MNPGRILVCDDDPALLQLTTDILQAEGHEVENSSSARQALDLMERQPYDLVLADLVLPGTGGLDLLREARSRWPETEVIIITGHGDIDTAVEAIKEGAYDYVTKPFHPRKFAIDVRKALEHKRLAEDVDRLRRRIEGRDALGGLIGRSTPMVELYGQIEQIASASNTVLILGESGTGKELTAREVHNRSHRRDRPFVAFSCSTIPSSLLEAELFGHVKGAYTGAVGTKAGLFESADGGTVFLDEIGATTPQAQAGLLRVLQDGEIRRLGATESRHVDVRVIAATNVDLERAMDQGSFRTDLYYRLAGVTLRLPPLRERAEDIPLLANHFLLRYAEKLRRPARAISPRALEMLCGAAWPGNVRELEHVLERAVLFAEREVVRPRDLPESLRSGRSERGRLELSSLEEVERDHIREVLRHTNGNKLKAAKILGIPRASLYRRIDKYGLREASPSLAPVAGGRFLTTRK